MKLHELLNAVYGKDVLSGEEADIWRALPEWAERGRLRKFPDFDPDNPRRSHVPAGSVNLRKDILFLHASISVCDFVRLGETIHLRTCTVLATRL